MSAPVGYVKTEDQRLEKNPDRRVQEAIALVFCKFQELGTVRQTLLWFLEEGLFVPTQTLRGGTDLKAPLLSRPLPDDHSPGLRRSHAYGKTEQLLRYEKGKPRHISRRKPRERWLVCCVAGDAAGS